MFVGRYDETELIRARLAADRSAPDTASIIAIHGLFGAGKTTLLRRVRSIVEGEGLADALFIVNEDVSTASLPEFVYHLAGSFVSLDPSITRFFLDETEARRRRYLQIVGRIGSDTMPLLNHLRAELHSPGHPGGTGGRDLEGEILSLELAIKNQFNNPDDQRLMLDNGNVLAESLIVDMMNTFFPLNDRVETLTEYIERGIAPKKIVILIDTYEKITQLLNPWLIESFLPYIYQKRFGDFHSYRTPYLPAGTFVREFFDVRIVIAGRERLSLTDLERRWDRYREQMIELYVGPFTRDELAEYLRANGFDPNVHLEQVVETTHSLPYLVALWVDAARAGANGAHRAFVTSLAEQRIFWYKTDEQKEWIRAAAFLDWFDADALRCFSAIGSRAPQAFEYLRGTSEVAGASATHPGKFELHGIIRAALREATFQESGILAEELKESAEAFYDADRILSAFPTEEREIVGNLAGFARFDEHAIGAWFGGEAHLVRSIVAEHPDLFPVNGSGWSMEPARAKVLRRYNRSSRRDTYQGTMRELELLWERRKGELEEAREALRGKILDAESRIRQIESQRTLKSNLRQSARGAMSTLEVDLQTARRRRRQGLTMRDSLVARTSFFFLVFCLLFVFFSDLIPADESVRSLVRTAALALSLLFLFVFALMLGRILYMKSRKKEMKDLREDVASAEERLRERETEYHSLSVETENAAGEIAALRERIEGWRTETAAIETRLREPYV